MESTAFKSRFIAQINNSFGSGGMSLALNEAQFSQFIQFLKREGGPLPIRKAVTIVGEQQKSPVWVLGRHLQIASDGEVVPEANRVFMWLDETVKEGLTCVTLKEILPSVHQPLSTSVLHRWVQVAHTFNHCY